MLDTLSYEDLRLTLIKLECPYLPYNFFGCVHISLITSLVLLYTYTVNIHNDTGLYANMVKSEGTESWTVHVNIEK